MIVINRYLGNRYVSFLLACLVFYGILHTLYLKNREYYSEPFAINFSYANDISFSLSSVYCLFYADEILVR